MFVTCVWTDERRAGEMRIEVWRVRKRIGEYT